MDTFYVIINKILKIKNNNFFTYNTTDNIDPSLKMIFGFGFFKINNENIPLYKKKFIFLKEIINNFIIKGHREEEVFRYFNKIQRTYNSFNRLAFLYKFKKAKLIVNTDMGLNEIQENEKNIICIYQENNKYLFKIFELIKIINMSLTHADNFFATPLSIKNPYNNLPFGKHVLYNIYYFLTEKTNLTLKINEIEIFLKFHSCHFNLTDFLKKYEYLLREKTIKNNIKNSVNEDAYRNIMEMIDAFNKNKLIRDKICIDKKFPKDKLVHIFNPYLNICFNSKYLLIPILKYKATFELEKKLQHFQNFNPLFGRIKIIYIKKICTDGKVRSFKLKDDINDSHIHFNEYNNDQFLKDHLSYKYINYSYAETHSDYDSSDGEDNVSIDEVD
jgi:hypothetical protein